MVHAAGSKLINVREGLHPDHSRIVLDCQGALPGGVGPATREAISVVFDNLEVGTDLDRITRRLRGGVRRIVYEASGEGGRIKLLLKDPGTRVQSFLLKHDYKDTNRYRVVVDIFQGQISGNPNKKDETAAARAVQPAVVAAPAVRGAAAKVSGSPSGLKKAAEPEFTSESQSEKEMEKSAHSSAEMASANTQPPDAKPVEGSESEDQVNEEDGSGWNYSGEAGLLLRAVGGEEESAESDEYKDFSQPITGALSFEVQKDDRLYLKGRADNIGQDDQYVGGEGGNYGKYRVDLSYDSSIHRYAYDARTLYSGVGSGVMTLDDALQTNLQAAPTSAETANRLNGFMSGAALGDPDVTRDKLQMGLNVFALDPFSFKVRLTHETKQGTRPFAGSFSTTEMVELFEPIDYETLEMRISAEYATVPVYLNVAYQYSQFTNNTDTLTFDNPLSATDALLDPSSGRIDPAPDNHYHNLSLTGSYSRLPWNSRMTANAAWGLMLQDDELVPFTTNTALAAPALPAAGVDAKVYTSLYNLKLASRPMPWMHVKGHAQYYDYDNQTEQIDFAGGYVETDSFVVGTAITNLPSSYSKTRAGMDFGFDVAKKTGVGVGYQYARTERENREVEEQDDHMVKLSADNRTLTWLDIRAAYERTHRDIGAYNFDVYLRSGDNLNQLPQLRKYDQADLERDRLQFQATFYPTGLLSVGASATYGMDDYADSPYGLLEDSHVLFALDADYAIGDRASVNLFYNYEWYKNTQRGSDGGTDWTAEGEDRVHSVGAGLKVALIPDLLDLDLSYTCSDVDGKIAFTTPPETFAPFESVDDARTHALDTKIKYRYSKYLTLSIGYLWEKFDYEDFAADGFSFVPTDTAGDYQGALLAGTLPEEYDVHIIYTQLTFRFH